MAPQQAVVIETALEKKTFFRLFPRGQSDKYLIVNRVMT